MGQRFDFTPTTDVQNLEIPITNGLTTLHTEFTIDAPEDPPGRIVSILGLRGNLTGKGRKKKRPLHFNFTQGQDSQARWEAEITALNPKGQERGPRMPFPGQYHLIIDWSAISGIASCTVIDMEGEGGPNALGRFIINGPSTEPITSGFLYIGGHISKPPAPGELPVYTTPLGCRMVGFVEFNEEKIGQATEDPGKQDEPPAPLPLPIPTPTPIPTPPVILTPPINIPNPPQRPTIPTLDGKLDLSQFSAFVVAATNLYPQLGNILGEIEPYIQALEAGKKLASGDFNISNPSDLIAVLQLINLFRSL
jgi:hypothetical protein